MRIETAFKIPEDIEREWVLEVGSRQFAIAVFKGEMQYGERVIPNGVGVKLTPGEDSRVLDWIAETICQLRKEIDQ